MKKKGFTLIELLAVIVVLAIVALIAVPVILNVIDKVRKESYRDSVYGIMESGKIYLASHIDSISEKEEIEFTCDGDKCTSINDELSFKGSVPKSGSIYINGDGLIEIESLYNGKYYANGTNEEGIEITNDSPMTRSELEEAILAMQEKYDREIESLKQENGQLVSKNNSQDSEINSLKSENNTIKEYATSIDEIYPVGSIYITLSSVNPSTLFPDTTWEKYSEGKTLVGHDGTTYKAGTTGGSKTATLTTANLPSHSHNIPSLNGSTSNTGSGYGWSHACEWRGTTEAGNHSHTIWGAFNASYASSAYAVSSGTQGWDGSNGKISTNGNHTHSSYDCYLNNMWGLENHNHTVTTNTSTTGNTGSGTSFSVQDPYTVVYMWKRVS